MHNIYAMPNTKQTPAERRLKYWIARSVGASREDACRFRDWNWHPLRGQLTQTCPENNREAVAELCQQGYEMFKGVTRYD